MIAFDLSDPPSGVDVALLCERPGLLLIGVDPGSDDLVIVSSRQRRAVAVADLLEVIHQGEMETRRGGDGETRRCGDAGSR